MRAPRVLEMAAGGRVSNRFRELFPQFLLVLALGYVGLVGSQGLDFGLHWDEPKLIGSVWHTVDTGVLLPHTYSYPSVSYDLAIGTLVPSVLTRAVRAPQIETAAAKVELKEYVGSLAYKLRVRAVFFLISILSAYGAFVLSTSLTGNRWAGLLAALILLGSLEFHYHARWIAPDAILACVVIWALAAQHRLITAETWVQRQRWLIGSSILVGVSISTKYPAGLMLVPLFLATKMAYTERTPPALWRMFLGCAAIVAATVLALSPGIALEPVKFAKDVLSEITHYGSRGHWGYTVGMGADHLLKLGKYLSAVVLSQNIAIAFLWFAAAIAGIMTQLREHRSRTLWLISFPLIYVIYLSLQRVMFARNYMLLVPILSVFAAVGICMFARRIRDVIPARIAAIAITVALLAHGLAMITVSARSISNPRTTGQELAIESRLTENRDTLFFLSDAVRETLGEDRLAKLDNVASTPAEAQRVMFDSRETYDKRGLYTANSPRRYRTIWSRHDEVNWNYYPSWTGHSRILEVSATDKVLEPLMQFLLTGN